MAGREEGVLTVSLTVTRLGAAQDLWGTGNFVKVSGRAMGENRIPAPDWKPVLSEAGMDGP